MAQGSFLCLAVKLLEPVFVSVTRCFFRVSDHTQNLQMHAGHILNFLKKNRTEEPFCVVGITMIDLYSRYYWNFVFRQVSLTDVVMFNFARCGRDFYTVLCRLNEEDP